jgi:hypothetical protein
MFLLLIIGCVLLLLAHASGAMIYRWGWRERDRHLPGESYAETESPETKPSDRWKPWTVTNNHKDDNVRVN